MPEPGAFVEKSRRPDARRIAASLGKTANALWLRTREAIADAHGPIAEEWVFGGAKYGWSLRLKRKTRAVVYLTPCEGYFRASFAVGEKAVRAAHDAPLPEAALALIDAAPRFAEGRAVRVEVRRASDVKTVASIAAIKMAN